MDLRECGNGCKSLHSLRNGRIGPSGSCGGWVGALKPDAWHREYGGPVSFDSEFLGGRINQHLLDGHSIRVRDQDRHINALESKARTRVRYQHVASSTLRHRSC